MFQLSPQTEALARRLASAQRLSIDEAIRLALEERARNGLQALAEAGQDSQIRRLDEIPEEYLRVLRKAQAWDGP